MTTLERALAKALTEIVITLDLDDAITPTTAMEVLDPAIALLQNLSEQDLAQPSPN